MMSRRKIYYNEPPLVYVRNVQPKGRLQRKVRQDREILEKQRIKNRIEGFVRHGEEIDNPLEIRKDAVGYMDDSERFHTDTLGDERKRRQQRLEKERKKIEALSKSNMKREKERWKLMEEEEKKKAEELDRLRNEKYKANKGSSAFNPFTMEYNDGNDGLRLKYADEKLKYNAAMRTNKLHSKMHLSGYNPITGESIRPPKQPQRPQTPEFMKKS